MIRNNILLSLLLLTVITFYSCDNKEVEDKIEDVVETPKELTLKEKLEGYASVKLTPDLSSLSENQKMMLSLLIEASDILDDIYWDQSYGNKEELFAKYSGEDTLAYININYGPWDRLDDNKPFLEEYEKRPLGANFYPADIKYLQFVNMKFEDKFSMYTLIRRDDEGELYTIPYCNAYNEKLTKVSELLKEASELADNAGFKKYLNLRAEALLNNNLFASDIAWLEMEDNDIDFIVGPVEDIDDRFLYTKTSYEAYLLIKDKEWSEKLEKFVSLAPELQKRLPIDDKYKVDMPVDKVDAAVYELAYCSGYCNAGGKSIGITHPLDGRVHKEKGNRKLQFKNAQKAKFDKILYPISEILISEDQRKHVKFDAFFENSLFYEVAGGLGFKKSINGQSVKENLKEQHGTMKELKSDVLRLYLITELFDMGKFEEKDLMDNYVTFMADIFRLVRFGTSYDQGKANIIRFNYFEEKGAFVRDDTTGTYSIDFDKMKEAIKSLSQTVLLIQVNGDYKAAKELVTTHVVIKESLQGDIKKIANSGVPTDIVFEQGVDVLGL